MIVFAFFLSLEVNLEELEVIFHQVAQIVHNGVTGFIHFVLKIRSVHLIVVVALLA